MKEVNMNNTLCGRDLLCLSDLTVVELESLLDDAARIKASLKDGQPVATCRGKHVGIIMQKPSLRTRVSFEVACDVLGAQAIVLEGSDNAFSRGESIHDTVKTLERYLDALVIRTYRDETLAEIASYTSIPVINALTDGYHPCQGLADLLTIRERFSALKGVTIAYVGDGSNNMAHTYLEAAALMGMDLRIGAPAGYHPDPAILERAQQAAKASGASIMVTTDPVEAVAGARVVITDTWASMGQEAEHAERLADLAPYRVDAALMAKAAADAIFLHCLPAHRGEEVTDEVIDSRASQVFDEAENRLHVQAALLEAVLCEKNR
jgi:ornithine carbamoyltransferase